MGNLGQELEEYYQKLADENIDIAEQMLQSHDTDAFMDLLNEFDIFIDETDAEALLSRCHSVVAEELAKFVAEKLDGDVILVPVRWRPKVDYKTVPVGENLEQIMIDYDVSRDELQEYVDAREFADYTIEVKVKKSKLTEVDSRDVFGYVDGVLDGGNHVMYMLDEKLYAEKADWMFKRGDANNG